VTYFKKCITALYPKRASKVEMPDSAEHWHHAVAIHFTAGTTAHERLSYARRCAGISVADFVTEMGRDERKARRYLSGALRPGVGSEVWTVAAQALSVSVQWLEHGQGTHDGKWVGPSWLWGTGNAIGQIYTKPDNVKLLEKHQHHGEERLIRAAIAEILATPVLAPVLLGDLEAVGKAMSPKGRAGLLNAQIRGTLWRADELANYVIKRGRNT
jgi:hypothetical protein